MTEWIAWLLLLSPMIVLGLLCFGLSCLFMKSCPACKMRIARTATKCQWCHEYVTTKPKVTV